MGGFHRRGQPIPGFGHVIYRVRDPRQILLDQLLREAWPDDPLRFRPRARYVWPRPVPASADGGTGGGA
ncbi:MAG: hypothetical protein GY713_01530 [Actinomycetia bacterium]|nr:hypothetical protein [Actinomycetes bacterium]